MTLSVGTRLGRYDIVEFLRWRHGRKNVSGTGDDDRLTNVAAHTDPLDWSPDGRFIVYRQMNRGTGWI